MQPKKTLAVPCVYMWGPQVSILGATLSTNGIFVTLAYVAAAASLYISLRKYKVTYGQFLVLISAIVVLSAFGASLLSAIEFNRPFVEIINRKAGSSILGGFVFLLLALAFFGKWKRIPIMRMLDLATPSILVGHTVGRLACFFVGDGCYGIETSSWLGMAFPNGLVPTYLPVYPTPLFESLYSFVILVVLFFWIKARGIPSTHGRLFLTTLSWMLVCRFLIEFIRVNPQYAGFSMAQWFSLVGTFLFTSVNYFLSRRSVRRSMA